MNFIKDFFTKDIWRKLIAFSIACVLYFNLYEYKERDIHDVKLEINHDPDVFIDPSFRNQTVRLKIKGSKRKVDKLAMQNSISGKVKFEYSADAIRTGKARIFLHPENFDCDRTVEIVGIEPEVIEFPVQKKISRDIKIVPVITGSPKSGKVCAAITPHPETVTVSGPEQVIKSLPDQIMTESFAIDGDDKPFGKTMQLIKPADNLQLSISSTYVTVDIRDSYDITRDISVTVKYLHASLQSDMSVELPKPNKASVKVKGNQSDINPLTRDNITVFADLSDITSPRGEPYTVPLKATLNKAGSSVQVVSIEPTEVKVVIKSKK